MKVIDPSALVREAADVLDPFRGDVVVVGAIAVEIAISDAHAAITPTRDVDVVVSAQRAEPVIGAGSGRLRTQRGAARARLLLETR